jgi:hypothetical protein
LFEFLPELFDEISVIDEILDKTHGFEDGGNDEDAPWLF